jgi:hypothetical protein
MLIIRNKDNVIIDQVNKEDDVIFKSGFTSINGVKYGNIKETDVSLINYDTIEDFKPLKYAFNFDDNIVEISSSWYSLIEEQRKQRDSLLAETDWSAGTDVIMSEEMRTYRQTLRDVPQQEGFPVIINWPTKP